MSESLLVAYSDGSSLERTARKVGKPLRAVESICKLFRKRMRQIGTKQGLVLRHGVMVALTKPSRMWVVWPPNGLDFDILGTDAGTFYKKCPRFRRAHYLIRGGILSPMIRSS